jgi:hypothetical protein
MILLRNTKLQRKRFTITTPVFQTVQNSSYEVVLGVVLQYGVG